MPMNKLVTIFICLLVMACSEKTETVDNASDVWMDRGIQCSPEIAEATNDLYGLPLAITDELAKYLDLEYGAPQFSEPLDSSKIKYVGEYFACNQPIKIWQYPCNTKKGCFVGVQPWNNGYLKTMVFPEFELNAAGI